MKYRLAILNDCECPEPRMVIIVREFLDGVHEWAYISAWRDLNHHRGWHRLKFPTRITELATFGVSPVIDHAANGHAMLRVERVADSQAQYSDGKPRNWQAPIERRTDLHPALLPEVIQCIAQTAPASATVTHSEEG